MNRIIALAYAVLALNGCDNATPTPMNSSLPKPNAEVMKIKMLIDGRILADDKPIDLDQLDQRLALLKDTAGVVWYYREAGDQEPHPNAIRIMELVVKNKLPISMSTKPDFSDYVGADGLPHPR